MQAVRLGDLIVVKEAMGKAIQRGMFSYEELSHIMESYGRLEDWVNKQKRTSYLTMYAKHPAGGSAGGSGPETDTVGADTEGDTEGESKVV